MKKRIRMLYVNGGLMDRGGISSVMMNYYLHFQPDVIQTDFLVHGDGPGERDQEILERGGKIYTVPPKSRHLLKNYMLIKRIIKKGKYDIVHSNADSGNAYILKIAKKCGVPVRISHSHNTDYTIQSKFRRMLNDIQKKQVPHYATDLWACSKQAGQWLYGRYRKAVVIPNAIDMRRFWFSQEDRTACRKKYGIGEELVIGAAGRLDVQKNHMFLLRVFQIIRMEKPSAKLMLAGDGLLRGELEKYVQQNGLSGKVIFAGQVSHIWQYYSAFDVFAMHSLFEGMPVSALEAQCSGLPCVLSDALSRKVKILPGTVFLSLESEKAWAEALISATGSGYDRKAVKPYIRKAGFDIEREAGNVQKRYVCLVKRERKNKRIGTFCR